MPVSRPIAIYTSYNVRYPLGGHVLAELHYIVGLQRLGYDVIVVEESGTEWAPCYNPVRNEMTPDPQYGISRLVEVLGRFGLENNWCYVDSDRRYHGLSPEELRDYCRRATMLFSRAGATWMKEFTDCRVKVFVDTDPAITQLKMPAEPVPSSPGYAAPHEFDFRFTIGEQLTHANSPIPLRGLTWLPTRHPVALELLPVRHTSEAKIFTTIMSWNSRAPLIHNEIAYGQKDVEFMKVLDLPQRVGPILEVALSLPAPLDQLRAAGWRIIESRPVTLTVAAYADYLGRSRAEFSVAKNAYVQARCGWFSDRSASYLATGKPVIMQDTGFSATLPTHEGLLTFNTVDEAAAAIRQVNTDYERHCRAARRVAEEYFDSDKVLGDLLRRCDLPVKTPAAPPRA